MCTTDPLNFLLWGQYMATDTEGMHVRILATCSQKYLICITWSFCSLSHNSHMEMWLGHWYRQPEGKSDRDANENLMHNRQVEACNKIHLASKTLLIKPYLPTPSSSSPSLLQPMPPPLPPSKQLRILRRWVKKAQRCLDLNLTSYWNIN